MAIIIPSPDATRPLTRACVEAVRATTAHLGAVVEVVESAGPGFRFARSVNRGIAAHPDADAWVLLNDDCAMEPGWLDAMVAVTRERPDAGLVGAVLRYPDGRVQHAGGYLSRPTAFLLRAAARGAPLWGVRRVRGGPAALCYHRTDPARGRIDFLTAACLLVTRRAHDRLGPFEEAYRFGFEDVDYGLRALEAGLEVALATQARGTHVERATGPRGGPAVEESEAEFNRRWPWRRILKATRAGGRKGLRSGASA